MREIFRLALQILLENSLTVSLVILGVIAIALAIIGKIPPMNIEGRRAVGLAFFGFLLIISAFLLALALAAQTSSLIGQTTPTQGELPNGFTAESIPVEPPGKSEVSPSNTQPIIPPDTPIPSPGTIDKRVAPTFSTNCGGWCKEIGGIPESGSTLSIELQAGELMMVTGGQLLISDVYCGGSSQQICVLIYEASKSQTVEINAVIPQNNYVGITDTYTLEQVISIKTTAFWNPPNCISGCNIATILYFRDGEYLKQETITP